MIASSLLISYLVECDLGKDGFLDKYFGSARWLLCNIMN